MTVRLLLALAAAASMTACTAPPPEARAADGRPAATPADDAASRWFAHVEYLANDDMRGRETGSPEHRKAADYVADQFARAGLEPAGIAGYLQPVTFSRAKIVEEKSSLALVRRGRETPVVLGEEATFGMRIDPAPQVEAPLVFAGHGLQIPETEPRRLRGPRRQGQGGGAPVGQPGNVPGALSAHYQSAAERVERAASGSARIGTITIPNPKSMDVPWERSAPNRLNPSMALADASTRRHAPAQQVSITFNPAQGRAAVRGLGPHVGRGAEDRRRGQGAAALRAADVDAGDGDGRDVADRRVAERRRRGEGQRSRAGRRVRRAHRAPRSRRRRRADQRRRHLQRRDGQRVGHRHADRGGHGGGGGAAEALGAVRGGDRRGEGAARLALLRAATRRCRKADLVAEHQHGHVPAAVPDEVGDGARASTNRTSATTSAPSRQGWASACRPTREPQRNRFIRSDQYSFIREGVPALAMKVGYEEGSPEAKIAADWTRERYHAPVRRPRAADRSRRRRRSSPT